MALRRPLRYGMVLFEEHGFARTMLERILANGLEPPSVVIQERSDVSAKRCGWYDRIISNAGATPPSMLDLMGGEGPALVTVPDMNGEESIATVKDADLDVLLLGGAAIVKADLFELPRHGTLNVHPGWLPDIRGSLPVAWSLVKDIPVGCTLHKVSDVLDGGDWIYRNRIDIAHGMTFDEVVVESCTLAGEQASRALRQVMDYDNLRQTPFAPGSAGPNFKWSSKVEAQARQVLEAGTYKHLIGSPLHGQPTPLESEASRYVRQQRQQEEQQEQQTDSITAASRGRGRGRGGGRRRARAFSTDTRVADDTGVRE